MKSKRTFRNSLKCRPLMSSAAIIIIAGAWCILIRGGVGIFIVSPLCSLPMHLLTCRIHKKHTHTSEGLFKDRRGAEEMDKKRLCVCERAHEWGKAMGLFPVSSLASTPGLDICALCSLLLKMQRAVDVTATADVTALLKDTG